MERLASSSPEKLPRLKWAWNKHGRHDLAGFDTNLSYAFWLQSALVDDPPPGATGSIPNACDFNPQFEAGARLNAQVFGWNPGDIRMSISAGTETIHGEETRYLDHAFLKEPGGQGPGAELTNNVMAEALVSMDLKRGRRIIDLELFGMDFVAPGSFIDSGALESDGWQWTDGSWALQGDVSHTDKTVIGSAGHHAPGITVDMPPQTFFDQIYTVAGYPINVEFYLISRAGMGFNIQTTIDAGVSCRQPLAADGSCPDNDSTQGCDSVTGVVGLDVVPGFSVGLEGFGGLGAEFEVMGFDVSAKAGVYGAVDIFRLESPINLQFNLTPMPGTMSLRGRGMMMPSFLSGRLGAYAEIGVGWFGFTYKRDILSWGPLVRLEPLKMYEANWDYELAELELLCSIPGVCGLDAIAQGIAGTLGAELSDEDRNADWDGPWENGTDTWGDAWTSHDTPALVATDAGFDSAESLSISDTFWDIENRSFRVVPGQLAGEATVTPSGAFEYQLELMAPPGVAGLTPSLSLGYNSLGTNGTVGVGWSLGGVDAIVRCPQTQVEDGRRREVMLDGDDALCWQGERLILVHGQHHETGAEYRTRKRNNARIAIMDGDYRGPRSFKVEHASGQVPTMAQPATLVPRVRTVWRSSGRLTGLKTALATPCPTSTKDKPVSRVQPPSVILPISIMGTATTYQPVPCILSTTVIVVIRSRAICTVWNSRALDVLRGFRPSRPKAVWTYGV